MINYKIGSLLNEQLNKELFSAYLYLDIAIYYQKCGLDGFANWFKIQALEEKDHAMMILEYLLSNDFDVTLSDINKPEINFQTHKTAIEKAKEHEEHITFSINEIFEKANKEKDYRTIDFLTWFIKEQAEEEKNAEDLLRRYQLFGGDPNSLYLLNKELSKRTYKKQANQ